MFDRKANICICSPVKGRTNGKTAIAAYVKREYKDTFFRLLFKEKRELLNCTL